MQVPGSSKCTITDDGRTSLTSKICARQPIGGIRAESVDGPSGYHQVAGAQGLDGFFDFGLSSSYHMP